MFKNFLKSLVVILPLAIIGLLTVKDCSNQDKITQCETELATLKGDKTHLIDDNNELINEVRNLKRDTAALSAQVSTLRATANSQKHKISTLYNTQYKFKEAINTLTDSVSYYENLAIATNNNAEHIMNYATQVAFHRDSLAEYIRNLYCDPTFHSSFEDEFVSISSTANKDTTAYDITFRDQILIEHERQKRFLRPDIWTVHVYSASPYSEKSKLSSYQLTEKPQRFNLGFHLGATYSTQTSNIRPVLSAGVNYNLIGK